MKEYMTLDEFVSILKSVPRKILPTRYPLTARGLRYKAGIEKWPRKKTSFGYKYHADNLPKAVRDALLDQDVLALQSEYTPLAVPDFNTPATLDALANLTTCQRDVMNARIRVLIWIDRLSENFTKKKVIDKLVSLSKKARTHNEIYKLLMTANARPEEKNAKKKDKALIARSTIFEWFATRKKHGVIGLAPTLTRTKDLSIPEWAPAFLAVYRRPSLPAISAALDDYTKSLSDPTKAPSYDQVKRFIKKLSIVTVNKGRMGPQELKRFKAFTRRDTSELWPTACYTADGHSFKATVLHPFHGQPFKPELTATLDVFTGYLTGWHAGLSENAQDVMYALSDAMIERDDGRHRGVGSLFYTDNGPGYKNKMMNAPATGFCDRWGMMPVKSIAYNSQARGMIEVLNKNLWIRAARKLDTYCGRDADKEATRDIKRITDKELRAGKMVSIHIPWKDFLTFLQEEVDAYNNRPHRRMPKIRDAVILKMRHMTPKEMWDKALKDGFEPYIIPKEHAAELHRPYERRKVSRCEVKLPTGKYFSNDLEAFHGDWVMVGYDIHDNSKVWVRDFDMRLLAVAELDGNLRPYFPTRMVKDVVATQRELLEGSGIAMTAAQLDQRKRTKNRLKTVADRTEEIMDEYMGPPIDVARANLIENNPDEPLTFGLHDMTASEKAGALAENIPPRKLRERKPIKTSTGRPGFLNNREWAEWLVNNPDKVTDNDRVNIKDHLKRNSFADLLKRNGIDLGSLLESGDPRPELSDKDNQHPKSA